MDETNLRESTNSVEPRSADFSGETPRYPMDGNSNCTTWCRWETYRAFRNGATWMGLSVYYQCEQRQIHIRLMVREKFRLE